MVTGDPLMDLSSLLRLHAEWVSHLRELLYGDGALNHPMASDHEACPLGQWLKQQKPQYGEMGAYRAVIDAHARFHHRAAYCLTLIDTGRRSDALAETQDTGELRRLSRLLVKTLRQLSDSVSAQTHGRLRLLDSQAE